jgi:hypothetical protein
LFRTCLSSSGAQWRPGGSRRFRAWIWLRFCGYSIRTGTTSLTACSSRTKPGNYLKEMRTVRDRWAHAAAGDFSEDDVYRGVPKEKTIASRRRIPRDCYQVNVLLGTGDGEMRTPTPTTEAYLLRLFVMALGGRGFCWGGFRKRLPSENRLPSG